MKKVIAFLMFITFIYIELAAQRLFFCSEFTPSGEPVSANLVWDISADGGNVYFLFQKNPSLSMPDTLYFNIYKLSGNDYLPFDVKTLAPEKDKSFAVLDYKFLSAGSYRVTVKDGASKELVKEYITINNKENTSASSSDYYKNSFITTGVGIDDNGVVKDNSAYYIIPPEGAYVIFKVDNAGKALNTDKLVVDIYKESDNGNYDFFETKNYDIGSQYDWVYFKYTFSSPGKYKFSVYNKDWNFINVSFVTIKSK